MEEPDVTTIAKAMETHLESALAPFDAGEVRLSREEAVLTLGLISALIGILEEDERSRP